MVALKESLIEEASGEFRNINNQLKVAAGLKQFENDLNGEGAVLAFSVGDEPVFYYKAVLKKGTDINSAYKNGDIELTATKITKAEFENSKNPINISYVRSNHMFTVKVNGTTISGNDLEGNALVHGAMGMAHGILGTDYSGVGLIKETNGTQWKADFTFDGDKNITKMNLHKVDSNGENLEGLPAKTKSGNGRQ